MATSSDVIVKHFRQILIWPLQLMPCASEGAESNAMGRHWQVMLAEAEEGSPWQPRPAEFDARPEEFEERNYREFVTFLPYVQRFLYGEKRALGHAGYGHSPLHVFRRSDIAAVLMMFKDGAVHNFKVAHVDLYFFYDVDVVILAFEIMGSNLPLKRVQDALFRFGRAFPAQWDEDGSASNCLRKVAWLDAAGEVISESDYADKSGYLTHLGEHHAPKMAAHWDYLLQPLVLHPSAAVGDLRYRQIEYHRMPLMAYLAVDDPFKLTDEDFYRLGTVTRPGVGAGLPYTQKAFEEFERDCCYDRFWVPQLRHSETSTRVMCNGHAVVMVGLSDNPHFSDPSTGVLGQFRHQHFIVSLIAHFHKAALLMFSDRLAVALSELDLKDVRSIREFRREIRLLLESFLRFNQRYWFREVSNQAVSDHLFQMLSKRLNTERLHHDVREAVQSMNQYLENDDLRRQADTVVRLTVVTVFGLVGTTVTGFLGMNLFGLDQEPAMTRLGYFIIVAVPITWLIFVTVAKSKVLSEFLDAMSDERISLRQAFKMLANVWRRRKS